MQTVVRLGQVLAGAQPFKAGNINDTYRGIVLTDEGERTAIIKDLEPKELANEVLVAAMALHLGLPVPTPVLALAMKDRLNATKGPVLGEGRLVYASIDVAQPQVAVLYHKGGGPRVLARLAEWKEMGRLYGFDALVANIDRHAGNILFSGDREVWIIDHGHCFTGPRWTPDDLVPPEQKTANRLNEWMTPVLDDRQRTQKAEEAALVETTTAQLNINDLALSNYMAELLVEGDLKAVLDFLNQRLPHVPRLAASALNIERML